MNFTKCIYLIILLCFYSPISEAKKRCKPLLQKLHNIQAMQRSGYSSKRGSSLRAKEDKARDNWWQCENNRRKKKKNTKKKGKNRAGSKTPKHNTQSKPASSNRLKGGTPFKTSNAIVIKSKYQGDKKRAWLAFYQQPKRCRRPKNLSEFAFCSEDKQTQRAGFELEYKQ